MPFASKLSDLTGTPEYLIDDSVVRVLSHLAESIRDTAPGRRIVGVLWKPVRYEPGCKICALGAVMERFTPPDQILGRPRSNLRDSELWIQYETQFGPVDKGTFATACALIVQLNDRANLSFEQIADVAKEALDGLSDAR